MGTFAAAGDARQHIYDELAVMYEQKNDKGAARANYEKAVNADGENDGALCHFVRLMRKGGDAKDGERIKEFAKKYLEVAPKGECAGEMH